MTVVESVKEAIGLADDAGTFTPSPVLTVPFPTYLSMSWRWKLTPVLCRPQLQRQPPGKPCPKPVFPFNTETAAQIF